jgi:hypothetical protein
MTRLPLRLHHRRTIQPAANRTETVRASPPSPPTRSRYLATASSASTPTGPEPYSYPPRHPTGAQALTGRGALLCQIQGPDALRGDGSWAAAYGITDKDLGDYTVWVYPVANQAALISYLDGLPATCSQGPITFKRQSLHYGEHGGIWLGTTSTDGGPSTGIYLIYAKGYVVYIIDNARGNRDLTSADKQALADALDYILRKANQVLGLDQALSVRH